MRTTIIATICLMMIGITVSGQSIYSEKVIKKSMKSAFKWQQKNPYHELNDWTNGAYYVGVSAGWKSTHDKIYLKGMQKMAEEINWQPAKRWYHADDITISQTFIDLSREKNIEANLEPTKETLDRILANDGLSPEWKEREIISWWWCDALFMAPPTLVKYGLDTNNMDYLKASDKLYQQTYDLLFDKDENLWARDTNYLWTGADTDLKEANGKKIFWSRGNGWVFGGLAILLSELPEDYENREFYVDIYKKMAERLKSIQPEGGAWKSSLLDPESHEFGETSGTGFYVFGFAWGINNGILAKEDYSETVRKGWKALIGNQLKGGKVGYVQPIGASPSKELNAESWEVYGTGAFLLAGSEVLKMNLD